MEYLELGDLEKCMDQKPLSEEEARDITFQVTEGLDFMHQHGYIHRDVHPKVGFSGI